MSRPARLFEGSKRSRLRLRVEDFELLADSRAFAQYGKTELIDGEVWFVNAQFARHARVKTRLAAELIRRLEAIGSEVEVLSEVAVQLNGDSMPEPDVVLTGWRDDRAVPIASIALVGRR